jgi:protein involved in polysaccharide export with SLBB domain
LPNDAAPQSELSATLRNRFDPAGAEKVNWIERITKGSAMKILIAVLASTLAVSGNALAQSGGNTVATVNPPASAATVSTPGFNERAPRYQIRMGDSFELQFTFSPEFNQTVEVQPDGYITLKSVGTIPAEGQTIPELTKTIEQAYHGILHDPVVTIDLKDFDKPFFVVSGQVGKPGKYDLRSDLTVTEGVAIAGGFTEASKHSEVVLFRPGANGMTEVKVINVKKMLKSRDLAEDIHLRPGDMIFVPQNRISKIQKFIPTASMGMYANPLTY